MRAGAVSALLCCFIAGILAMLCGLGVKTNQSQTLNPGANSSDLAQSYFSNTGFGKIFGGLFSHREPTNWDEMLQFAGDASSRGDYSRAEKYLRMAIDSAEKEDPNDIRVATAASYLANVETKAGKLSEAEQLYRKALSIDEKHLGANNPDVVEMRRDLADVLRRAGKEKEAAKLGGVEKSAHAKQSHVRIAHHKSSRVGTGSNSPAPVGFNVSGLFQQ